jgi:broad specificity phosphatase PhoE
VHLIVLTHAEVNTRCNRDAFSMISFAKGDSQGEAGSKQVEHAARFFAERPGDIDVVFSSPTGKCVDTAMEFARRIQTWEERVARITNDWLEVDALLWHDAQKKPDGPEMAAWPGERALDHFRRIDGSHSESCDAVLQRWTEKTVLVVTHNRLAHTLPVRQAKRFKDGAIKTDDDGNRFFSAKPVMFKCEFGASWADMKVEWAYSFA